MSDLSLKEYEAQQWILNVRNEEQQVRIILQQLTDAARTTPDEEDDIFKGIASAAETARNFWDNMCDGFDKTCDIIKSVFAKMGETVSTLVSDVDTFKGKIGK